MLSAGINGWVRPGAARHDGERCAVSRVLIVIKRSDAPSPEMKISSLINIYRIGRGHSFRATSWLMAASIYEITFGVDITMIEMSRIGPADEAT